MSHKIISKVTNADNGLDYCYKKAKMKMVDDIMNNKLLELFLLKDKKEHLKDKINKYETT